MSNLNLEQAHRLSLVEKTVGIVFRLKQKKNK